MSFKTWRDEKLLVSASREVEYRGAKGLKLISIMVTKLDFQGGTTKQDIRAKGPVLQSHEYVRWTWLKQILYETRRESLITILTCHEYICRPSSWDEEQIF